MGNILDFVSCFGNSEPIHAKEKSCTVNRESGCKKVKTADSENRKNYRKEGKLIGIRDSGGRFQKPPSLVIEDYQCLNHPKMCERCVHYEKQCASKGIYWEAYGQDENGEYRRKLIGGVYTADNTVDNMPDDTTYGDQTELANIAKNDKEWLVRRESVYKLTDQSVLTNIAGSDMEWLVRFAACEKLGGHKWNNHRCERCKWNWSSYSERTKSER